MRHRESGNRCRILPVQIGYVRLQHDVDEPVALGLDHRVDVFDPVGPEDGVEEAADLPVPGLGDLTEEMLVLRNGENSRGDPGDRSELGAKRLHILQRRLDVGEP